MGVAGAEENYDFRGAGEFRMGDKGTGIWPEVGWKWRKWTFGWWTDPSNRTRFGIDFGPLEIVWRMPGYRP